MIVCWLTLQIFAASPVVNTVFMFECVPMWRLIRPFAPSNPDGERTLLHPAGPEPRKPRGRPDTRSPKREPEGHPAILTNPINLARFTNGADYRVSTQPVNQEPLSLETPEFSPLFGVFRSAARRNPRVVRRIVSIRPVAQRYHALPIHHRTRSARRFAGDLSRSSKSTPFRPSPPPRASTPLPPAPAASKKSTTSRCPTG